ncbi:substrate-binding domain-containing protein [Thalassoglobus polymorphus]|uniref:D-allose-binding periplasmic protein n=1 Tax=Thalassoglobus polymorphus TaxID=2527994 RepID=A0A517QST1_9PLAN|nr:substrate-binding domain-containing protein [Thalassoglobus polymorphus]QDT34673.1 D-allose-binding periplasmic protein precursor [Thalassoglobus polymorphus]
MDPLRRSFLFMFSGLLTLSFMGCPGETPEAGPGANGGKKRIVLLTNGPDPFWDTCEAGAVTAEKELDLEGQGYVLSFERGDFTDKAQLDKLKQYNLKSDIVAVGISVYNPESAAIAREMKKLRDKGVKVICFDGDIDREQFRDARFAYLGTDNIVGGRELGRAAKAIHGEGAKYSFFVGSTSSANAVARMDGFVEGMGKSGEEMERLADGADKKKARENVEGALDRNADLNMLVGIWAYNTPQIVQVVKDRNLTDKVDVACFDAAEASIKAMGEGDVDVMVVQNPYQIGYESVKLLLAMVEGDQLTIDEYYPDYAQEGENDLFKTELRVVVPDGSPVKKEIFAKETVFMTYEEFKAWLEDRSLVSS